MGFYVSDTSADERTLGCKVLPHRTKHQQPICQVHATGLRQVDHEWQAFWAANIEYQQLPNQFTGCLRLPHYKHKTECYTSCLVQLLWLSPYVYLHHNSRTSITK